MATPVSRRQALTMAGTTAVAVGGLAITGLQPATAAPKPPPGPLNDPTAATPDAKTPLEQQAGQVYAAAANPQAAGMMAAQVDPMVLAAQQWVNATYGGHSGYVKVPETGKTGWSTMFSLTRGLQIELGVAESQLSDTFGPTTVSLLTSKIGNVGPGASTNVVKIVQSGLYCKGYSGESISGAYGGTTQSSVLSLRRNMGFADPRTSLAPKEFKALLTMDAYVLLENGTSAIRAVQQWLNTKYYAASWFYIVPCDGLGSRSVQTSLIYALQIELAIAAPNGTFGPTTRSTLKARPSISVGAADSGSASYVRIFQAGLILNRYAVVFDGRYTAACNSQTLNFQAFVALPVTGLGDYQTWCSLMASNGDPDRAAYGIDCSVDTVTTARVASLKGAGYRIVGRYLTNASGANARDKKIKPGELATIFGAGLSVFPIYQTYGGDASYFTPQQGTFDASDSLNAASGFGFSRRTIIYYGVDFDALDTDIVNSVIPYFQALTKAMAYYGSPYRVGVYAVRNACTQLAAAGLTQGSFVLDMSNGYSGNLGYPLPRDWNFDQIATTTVGSGTGAINIDRDVTSGRDTGVNSVAPRSSPTEKLDVRFDQTKKDALIAKMQAFTATVQDNTTGLLHSESDAVNTVLAYDETITNLSRGLGIRKAMIQAEAYWEFWKQTPADLVADTGVIDWYNYQRAYEIWRSLPVGPAPTPPVLITDDSSTGIGQIFGKTGIIGLNWAVGSGLLPAAPIIDASDWHNVWTVWDKLHSDDNYNLNLIALVLLEGGSEVGVPGPRLTYSQAELQSLFARYNGAGSATVLYGQQVFGVYSIFESYNATFR